MSLDIRTLIVLVAILSFGSAVMTFLIHKLRFSVQGILFWVYGSFSIACGLILLSFRSFLPDFVTIIFSNTAIIYGFALILSGMRVFVGRSSMLKITLTTPIVIVPLLFWYSEIQPLVSIRIVFCSIAITICSGAIAYELLREANDSHRLAQRFTGYVFAVNTAFFLVRILLTIIQPPTDSFFNSGAVTIGLFLWLPVFSLGITAGIALMIGERLKIEQKRAAEALKISYGELEQRVEERTVELFKTNEKLIQEIKERSEIENRQRFLRDLAVGLSKTETLSESLQEILTVIFRLDEFDSGGIYLADEENKELYFVTHHGLHQAFVDNVQRYDMDDIRFKMVMKGDPIYLATSESPATIRKDLELDGIISMAMIPIKCREKIIGSINLASHTHDIISDYSKSILTKITEIEIGMSISRVMAENALRESQERLNAFMESATDGFVLLDSELNHIEMNKAALEMLGLERKDVIGKNIIDTVPNIKETNRYNEYKKVMKTGIPFHLPNLVSHPLFGDKNIELKAFKVGEGLGIIFTEITKRKQLEEQLRHSHKMESIGTMAGGIAHDFNNILYMIIGNTELALEDIPQWNPVHKSLGEIKTAGLRAAGIVKQLLSFSRKTEQDLKPIGTIAVIKDALKFLRSMIPSTIEIRTNILASNVTIIADPIQIGQLLINLCINASQAMEKAGGILEITVENEILKEDMTGKHLELASGNYCKISVSDTGSGIERKIIDRIFDPYFTTKDVGSGSGMGLAVVHGIVKSHGGAIAVESKLEKGTTFNIFFPVVAEKPSIENKATDELPLGNERVIFVDDEKSIAEMTEKMLSRLGYKTVIKTNPIEVLELFTTSPDRFDLIITDMTMPEMTGVKLLEKLKAVRPDIPVIICTGHSSLIDEEKAKEMGIAAYIMKPIMKQDMAKTIRKVLDKKRS